MNNNKLMASVPIILVVILMTMTPLLTQSVSANKGHGTFNGPIVPTTINGDGTTTTECIKNCDLLSSSSNNAPAASTAKSESASSARSDNNVKCFAFCLGISNANSGSAADSNSRTNSPGNTASALPVSPQSTTIDTTVGRPFSPSFPVQPHHSSNNNNNHHSGDHPITNDPLRDNGVVIPPPSAAASASVSAASITGVECIDNTGSAQDSGYAQGYVDGNRDSAGLNGHGYDDSLSGNHTPEFRQGYHDGYLAGWHDGKNGINLQPC